MYAILATTLCSLYGHLALLLDRPISIKKGPFLTEYCSVVDQSDWYILSIRRKEEAVIDRKIQPCKPKVRTD